MSADAELQLSLAALVELVFSGASARRMLEVSELRIIPDKAAAKVLPFLAALAIDATLGHVLGRPCRTIPPNRSR